MYQEGHLQCKTANWVTLYHSLLLIPCINHKTGEKWISIHEISLKDIYRVNNHSQLFN